ncbi:MAG: hypothetical protein AB4040_16455 [Synechococcus sp.]
MNDTPVRISSTPPTSTSMNYAALREKGMQLIRELAQDTWTDHNVHDPGITLLEAFSYAMTELGFRLQQDVADLLRSGESHALPDFVPVHRALPSAPIAAGDWQKMLLDHPLVSEARIVATTDSEVPFFQAVGMDPPFTYDPGSSQIEPRGLYEVMLVFETREWNSNTYSFSIEAEDGGDPYQLDIALPYWDEAEAAPFRAGATVNSIAMLEREDAPAGQVWRALTEPLSYFGTLRVSYNDTSDATDHIDLWVLLHITSELDRPATVITGILTNARTLLETSDSTSPISQFVARVQEASTGALQVHRYAESWRNLCEYPIRLKVARVQEIGLRARIEVTGSTDLEQLLAEIYFTIDLALSPLVQFSSLAEMRDLGKSAEALYDGPLLKHGFLKASDTEPLLRNDKIYTSDILRIIMRLRSSSSTDVVAQENPTGRDIVAVTDLALSNYVNNRPITTDAPNCLNLVEIDLYRPRLSLSKSRINFVRNDVEVAYDPRRVTALFDEKQSQYRGSTRPQAFSPVWPVQPGDWLPIEDYFAFQNDLPRIFGVGEGSVSWETARDLPSRTLQTQGYLLLFEQFLADLTAQLGNINRFFSANPEEQSTYFTRALFELPGMQKLLKRLPMGSDWPSYVDDPNNSYRVALRAAVESHEQLLDRRNRMLDRLLAIQGEDMVTWTQERHRWAQAELNSALELAPLPPDDPIDTRRQAVNAGLIGDKADFLAAIPDLNSNKLQGFGHPLRRDPEQLQLEQNLDGYFHWVLVLEGEQRLRSADSFPTQAAATIESEDAAILATQRNFYRVESAGSGRFHYELRTGAEMSARIVGTSVRTWTTTNAANDASIVTSALFARLRIETAAMPMERRIAHLTGIRDRRRRRLSLPIDEFFEIYDELDSDGIIEKRWRLWTERGYTGSVLLSSTFHFEAPTDGEAVALAQGSIQRVLRYGLNGWNYRVSPAGPGTFNFELLHPNGEILALRLPSLPSVGEAQAAIDETIHHLYSLYSAEGFHTIEHILLRPHQQGDRFLSLPLTDLEQERDPYSQRLSLIFPSGYARDFSLDSEEPQPISPARFRDREFRRHAERIVQQACPVHLFPKIYWVDRHIQLTDTSPTFEAIPSCFEHFEAAYFRWLETQLFPGIDDSEVDAAREALIISLNGVANGT